MSSTKKVSESIPDNQCPECKFTGNEQFPKGFGKENFQKTVMIEGNNGEKTPTPVYDKVGEPVLVSRRRCPVCGFKEGKLVG